MRITPSYLNYTGGGLQIDGSAVTAGTLSLSGEALSNTLIGGSQDDTISGFGGNDVLKGGGGNETLIGGSGSDSFVFASNFGNDTVTDFDGGTGGDRLQFAGGLFADEADVFAHAVDTADGLVISHGTDTVTLVGVHLPQYHAGDFLVV